MCTNSLLISTGLLIQFAIHSTIAQTIDPIWKMNVVLLETKISAGYMPTGTGVLVKYRSVDFLVTNSHVAATPNLFVRLNVRSPIRKSIRRSLDTLIAESGRPWMNAPKADVSILSISHLSWSSSDTLDHKAFGVSLFKTWDYLQEGDDLYVLGFPMQIGTADHYSPVYRSGIIALKQNKGEFLIDCNIYPGNSGGPVFLRPAIYDDRADSNEGRQASFVGIVSAYIPYTDVAISQQTQRPRVTFEENSGLAIAYSIDVVVALLEQYFRVYPNQK